MKQIIKYGTTSKRLVVFIQNGTSTVGAGLTGLTSASSGLSWYYYREDSTVSHAVSIVGETIGTWTSGGFVEIDSTNLPGFYEIGVPNAVLASTNSPTWAVMELQGVAGMVPVNIEIQLVAFDPTDATKLGLSVFPTNFSSMDIDVSGRVDVSKWLGTAVTAATGGVPDVNTKNYNNQTAQTDANNLPKVNVTDWNGAALVAPNIAGVPKVDVTDWLGTAVTAATAGVPDVNTKNYAGQTAVVDANNLPKVNVTDWGGAAVPAPNVAGVPKTDVADWLGTAVTSNAGVPVVFTTNTVTSSVVGTVTLGTGQLTVKRSTALLFTFPMVFSSNSQLAPGQTVVTQVSIDGGGVTTTTNAPSEIGSGLYKVQLQSTELAGTNITLLMTASGCLPGVETFITQA